MPYIQSIATLPGHFAFEHDEMADFLDNVVDSSPFAKKYRALAKEGSIAQKRTFLPNFKAFLSADIKKKSFAPTSQRMHWYKELAPKVGAEVACNCLKNAHLSPSEITDIITVSCTGNIAPGLESILAEQLGLNADVNRYAVNFMGCYASLHALRLAKLIAQQNPQARILLISVELSGLHFNKTYSTHNLLGTYLFNDGAAACVISGTGHQESHQGIKIHDFHSRLYPSGKKEMGWEIGDWGFELTLSSRVPIYIKQHIREALHDVLPYNSSDPTAVRYAVHPGGKNILKAFEQALNLSSAALQPSWSVLKDYGNMSSAAILFVLKEIMEQKQKYKGPLIAAAFGPGLTVEMAHLEI